MPIRSEYRHMYGSDWKRYRTRMIEIHGTRCSVCGRDCPRYLNFAHATHNPLTSSIVRLCAADHARHDAPHRRAVMRARRARQAGQLWLIPEAAHGWKAGPGAQQELFA